MSTSNLPNLIIIGAMKCATTSLHYYLDQHPDIFMSRHKELNFFIDERNWSYGRDWYCTHFGGQGKIWDEASPNYTAYPRFQNVAQRMHNVLPNAKLIYLVRDPIERIVSHYLHLYTNGHEQQSPPEALQNLEENKYVLRSQYYMQLEQYLKYYPLDQILVLQTESLQVQRRETLAIVFYFLGVDSSFDSSKFKKVKHPTRQKRRLNRVGQMIRGFSERHLHPQHPDIQRYLIKLLCTPFSRRVVTPTLDENLRRRLQEALFHDMARLRGLTGQPFAGWSV
ncbi:sulfotransferase domain-containing protein [Chloroflexi bacterium TSY]|nr:sulfotransferase domain-containing protein [Chloroflexi bacterium TSY]